MYYPDELIEEVRSKNDIVDVISGYVRIQKKGSSYFGLCPFHNEKSPSFSVSPGRQMYYCFGCGAGGNVFTFLMAYENCSFPEAIKQLADRAGVPLPEAEYSEEVKKRESKRARLLEINKEAARYFYYLLRDPRGEAGRRYLTGRQLSEETMKKFGLGFASVTSNDLVNYLHTRGYEDELVIEAGLASFDEKYGMHDKFWNRVMFPIQDINHKVIGFGGRVMGDAKPKYLNSPETMIFDKSRNLYGLNFARTSRKSNIILCEGYMDVIAMHQAGFTQAVASLGTAFTAGLRGRVINMAPAKDPDEFIKANGAEAFQERIDKAENSFFFELRILERDYDLGDPASKTAFHREIARKLCSFEEEVERENYVQSVAEKYHIGYEALRKLVASHAAQTGMIKPVERPKPTVFPKNTPQENAKKFQRLLLTWITDEPALYGKIKKYIGVEDFTEALYKQVAQQLFEDLESGNFHPASIISMFQDEEEQREVASLFNTKLQEVNTEAEREKAFHDIVYQVKRNSFEYYSGRAGADMNALNQVISGKKALEELSKTHISLH